MRAMQVSLHLPPIRQAPSHRLGRFACIELVRIEFARPFDEVVVLFVPGVGNRFQELSVAPNS
jgi:hypothetical protein